ncbi:cytochrome P450, partial [Aureobasidium melanogenum]
MFTLTLNNEQSHVVTLLLVLVGVTGVYLVFSSILQYWRLRHIPGPPLAGWTNLWLMQRINGREKFYDTRKRLHQKYGPIQRYGPNRVMFSDVSAVHSVLPTSNVLPKADSYDPLKVYVNGTEVASFLAITNDDKAARLKRFLHPTFSPNGVLRYESHVDHTVSELISHLRNVGPTTDLAPWFAWFAFDTITRIGFSEDQGFMRQQKDIGGAGQAAQRRFAHWIFYWTIPWLDALLYKNWFVKNRKTAAQSGLVKLALRVVEDRKAKGGLGIHHDLLDLYMESGKQDPQLYTPSTILGLTMTTIHAGAETTAYTSAICMYLILSDRRVHDKLREELQSIMPATETDWELPETSVLRKLPYLDACIKESARLKPSTNVMGERVVNSDDAVIAGVPVPRGTIVAMNTAGLNTDPSIWGQDVEVFRPERWLEASEEQRVLMHRANLTFSAGKRICLGMHIAWMEMKKVISALVMNFDIELVHPEEDLKQTSGVFGVPEEIKVYIRSRTKA